MVPQIFTRARIDQGWLAHTSIGDGIPPKIKDAHLKLGLKSACDRL